MRRGGERFGLHLGWLAGVMFGAAVLIAGASLSGFDQGLHSISLLGSRLAPHALAFNFIGFGATGLCVTGFALALESRLRSAGVGRSGRLATSLLLISSLAFAALGALPFDPVDGDGAQSRRHVFAYTIVLLAWLPSVVLLAWAVWRRASRLSLIGGAFALSMLFCLLLPADAWLPRGMITPGHAQRVIFLLYFAWVALVAVVALRAESSGDA